MAANLLKKEILVNLKNIKIRFKITIKLLKRYLFNKQIRTINHSYDEYDNFWDDFWELKTYLKNDLPIVKNGVLLNPNISALEFKEKVVIEIISKKIKEEDIKSVLEIGSGAGLNLMFLAPRFPNVKFYGIEPTESGVRVSNEFISNPPEEFSDSHKNKNIDNVEIIRGSILDENLINQLKDKEYGLVFSCAVLEQLNCYIDIAFKNIFNLNFKFFLFYEEWLEANSKINNYKTLIDNDYFRMSTSYLNNFPADCLEFQIPLIQPSWLSYGSLYGRKVQN